MKYELGDILPVYNERYMVMELATFEDKEYLLVNKLGEEDEPSDENYVFKKNNNGVLMVTDKKVLDIILPVFANKLQREVNEIINKQKYNIN